MQYSRSFAIPFALVLGSVAITFGNDKIQSDKAFNELGDRYASSIRPLLKQYCSECHSADKPEADVDLDQFASFKAVRGNTKTWERISAMLASRQMPPKDSGQPTDAERIRLQQWVDDYLTQEAESSAGDPGPIVLRRLSNDEYNYTIRDLTGVDSLDPTNEFPVDGAAGEGFTNTGSAQGMSPALVQKYLDAAKDVAEHVVLLPDGIRFSPHTSRRDHTDELLARIQAFYRQFTEDGGGSSVDLQGIKFDTNQGGLLPVEKYLAATLEERDAIDSGNKTLAQVAADRALSPRYLTILWTALVADSTGHSLLLDGLRNKWRVATPNDAPPMTAEIAAAQDALWKFNPVGQIGREAGPKTWMEAVSPVTTHQELRFKLPEADRGKDITIYLTASDLGDGNEQDFVVWEKPRIEFDPTTSKPPILLRDVRALSQRIEASIASELPRTDRYLEAVSALYVSGASVEEIAASKELNPSLLATWADFIGLGNRAKREVNGLFTNKVVRGQGYAAINGWASDATPSMLTNSSQDDISFLTLTVPARGVTVHPSPTQESVVAWRSPIQGKLRLEGLVADADNKCGNGASWRVELLSETGTAKISSGIIDNGRDEHFKSEATLAVRPGDIVSLIVNARDGSHVCDTTHVKLKLTEITGEKRVWNLASDVVDNILSGNPLPDSYGNDQVWHFAARDTKPKTDATFPPDSMLAAWRSAVINSKPVDELKRLASAVQNTLTTASTDTLSEPDTQLRELVTDWNGPLSWATSRADSIVDTTLGFGLDPAQFGKHPDGSGIDSASLCVIAPQLIKVRLPASLVSGAEFVTGGTLHGSTGKEGTVQLQVLDSKPTDDSPTPTAPFLVSADSKAQQRVESAINEYRMLFPAALCYARIVPVDEVVTLTLFHRDDDHLQRLMLDEEQVAELDRLWDELYYVSQEPLKLVVALEQITQFATQDRQDLVPQFKALKDPIEVRAGRFRKRLAATEPAHLEAVLRFAGRAWRRPLSESEQQSLRDFYESLRKSEIPHKEAVQLTLARVLASPSFLYRHETVGPNAAPMPVSSIELASRLSYFLWSSMPDDELRLAATDGKLSSDAELVAQTRRLLGDTHTRRLAIQFACQWLHIRNFDQEAEKNEKLYPEFVELRSDMYEETVRFFEDMFRNDRSILSILDADHTFVNESLASHYGIASPASGRRMPTDPEADAPGSPYPGWRRVENVKRNGRGGLLGMATILASQSGASRTSPILRGNWVYETLLGERLPRPPAGVPVLPDEPPKGLTARKLIEQHSSVEACAKCHLKIDPFGFALEQYDAVGRRRPEPVDTTTKLVDDQSIEGIDGLRDYLLNDRRDDIVRQFCRKLLGYALGREVQLSDQPLLDRMLSELSKNEYRFSVAVESIVLSDQFRQIRGRLTHYDQATSNR